MIVIATAVFSYYYGPFMWSPNTVAANLGGDGLTIHYNLQYHATYGEGVYLTGQYFPTKESLFMTDSQAMIAVLLSYLRPIVPGIETYSVGISNALTFWSNILAVLILFLVLRKLEVTTWLAIVFALLIALMSPQVLRQVGGQYTLGFTFLLPLTILYQLSYSPDRRYWLWTLLMIGLITFFGLNNPYTYGITVAFLLAGAFFGFLFRFFGRRDIRAGALVQWLLVVTIATACIYFTIHYFDPVDDRTDVPFGFFHNIARWGGLLRDENVFADPVVQSLFPDLARPRWENRQYLGLVPVLFFLLLPVLYWRYPKLPLFRRSLLAVQLLAGVVGLLFALTIPFKFFPDWSSEHLQTMLSFRAPVRFTWPLYYMLGILAACGIAQLSAVMRRPVLRALVIGIPLLAWGVEAHQFSTAATIDHIHPNTIAQDRLAPLRAVIEESGIDSSRYSSIYGLPAEQGWSGKVHRLGSWRSNIEGYKYSLASGLPMITGKLSHASLRTSLASLQLISNPLIERVLLPHLPQDKSILLLISQIDDLLPGEAELARLGERVYLDEVVELRRVTPAEIEARHRAELRQQLQQAPSDRPALLRSPLEDNPEFAFVGSGSQKVGKGWQQLPIFPLPDSLRQDSLELSVWNYADNRRFGGPNIYLRFMDADGERISEQKVWANEATDTQRGWFRLSWSFVPPPGTVSLDMMGEYFYHYYLDEWQLRRVGATSRYGVEGPNILLNNYLVSPSFQ